MLKNDDININANNLTEQVIKRSKIHIPYKFVKVRQLDTHWMNNNIKQMMRKRNRYMTNAKEQRMYQIYKILDTIVIKSRRK